ncbi:MAG: fatty acid hydroxylase [Frankiales bacterium]|nr:fatty acid hydroxylase [Frankiales bacterium]
MPAVTCTLTTLSGAAREFGTHRSPQLLVGELVLLLTARLLWPTWSVADALVVAALVAFNPFSEWLIHVFILHCPADGSRRDRLAGYSHRRHHAEPRDLRFQFIHPAVILGALPLNALILLGFRTPSALTAVLTIVTLTLTYEWVHFLIHTDYAPRSALYRRLHRAHRLHHYRNEKYWLGVATRFGDRVLGTNPRKEDVEVSPTAKTALASR